MQVFVRCSTKYLTIELKPNDLIRDIKERITEKEGIPPNNIQLTFIGKLLNDDEFAYKYGIQNNSTIFLSVITHPPPIKIDIQIKISNVYNREIKLNVKATDKIKDIKAKLRHQQGFQPDTHLYYNDIDLEDKQTLEYYSIKDQDTLIAIVYQLPRVILTINTLSGNNFTIDVEPTFSISNLKAAIEEKKQFPVNQQHLFLKDKELEDFNTLDFYSITTKTPLNLVLIKSPTIRLKIRSFSEGNFFLNVDPTFSIADVKYKIENEKKIPFAQQHIFLNNIELDDQLTVEYYSIDNNASLFLLLCRTPFFRINIKKLNGETFSIEVGPLFSIENVKDQICKQTGILPHQQILVYNNVALDGARVIQEYPIQNNSTLFLLMKKKPLIWVCVQSLNGVVYTIEIQQSSMVIDLKTEIKKQNGINEYTQRLIFNGNYLDNTKTLEFYSIENQSLIHLV